MGTPPISIIHAVNAATGACTGNFFCSSVPMAQVQAAPSTMSAPIGAPARLVNSCASSSAMPPMPRARPITLRAFMRSPRNHTESGMAQAGIV